MAANPTAKQVFIQGVTRSGRTFRPSDWAERLAGVMSQFRPGGGSSRIGSHLAYSPWCVPTVVNGIKVVIVHTDLREADNNPVLKLETFLRRSLRSNQPGQ